MAHIKADRVLETSTTTGTGAFALAAAVAGYRRFSSVMTSPSDTCYYYIEAVDASGIPTGSWETGLGTYSASNTLTRTTPLASSNGGAAVNFSAGTKRVAISAVAAAFAANRITNTPAGGIAATDVQTALNELDTEKVAKAGDTMTGLLTINPGSISPLALPGDAAILRIVQTDNVQPRVLLDGYDAAGVLGVPNVIFRKSRYSASVVSAIQSGDSMGQFSWFGYGATGYSTSARAQVQGIATENWTDTAQGMRFGFRTTPNGTAASAEVLSIEQDGSLAMGGTGNTIIDANRLHRLRQYTVATLPTVGTAGRLAAVTDANAPAYNATVAGGGAVKIPVYDNGTNWVCH